MQKGIQRQFKIAINTFSRKEKKTNKSDPEDGVINKHKEKLKTKTVN